MVLACNALRRVILVLKDARYWNSDSASSNIGFLSNVPRARINSTRALTKTLRSLGNALLVSVAAAAASPPPCLGNSVTRFTRLDSSSSTLPVSNLTALFVGVVAVI